MVKGNSSLPWLNSLPLGSVKKGIYFNFLGGVGDLLSLYDDDSICFLYFHVCKEAINCSPTNLFISFLTSVGTNPLLVFFLWRKIRLFVEGFFCLRMIIC